MRLIRTLAMTLSMMASFSLAQNIQPVALQSLPGWPDDNHADALAAFQRSCREILTTGHGFNRVAIYGGVREDWLQLCQDATTAIDARAFFETRFQAYRVSDESHSSGLFTGYYEPQAEGSRTPGDGYGVPVYRRPADLVSLADQKVPGAAQNYGRIVDGKPLPYFSRREIETGALSGKGLEIVWLKHWEDAYFIHIQGSGRILLPDGSAVRLAYAAKSGLPYTAIGGVLINRGILTKESNSMQSIREWMRNNPADARELMWQNQSFVFFREVEVADPALGALGAQQVSLTPHRSLAVDRANWMLGTPVWLDTTTPLQSTGGAKTFRHLMIAQDTGSAIKGMARGDVYWGWGDEAALIAGHMKSPGTMTVLLPKSVSARLNLPQ